MTKRFLVTTPIYYPSGDLHLGHAYTTTLADILKRYKQLQGYETFFLTGADEHGQKIARKAAEANQDPMTYLDGQISKFKELWAKLEINYDYFVRTTDPSHQIAVQKIFSYLLRKGLIYKGYYEGIYCVSCEEFLTNEQTYAWGVCKVCKNKIEHLTEETYFLKISESEKFIEGLLKKELLIPRYRRDEILKNFVEPGLKDLSVTRISVGWGIPMTEDPKHVIYVWLDALTNYISALGYGQKKHELLDKFWAEDTEIVHIIGKEITRFHAIYWPIILDKLNLRLPNKLLAHGWILNRYSKMSKSLNNVINPLDIINLYGADSLRFYLANNLSIERDGNFTIELFEESYNSNLANNIGNLISRVHSMLKKYRGGKFIHPLKLDLKLFKNFQTYLENYQSYMDKYQITEAVWTALTLGNYLNFYIEQEKPWELAKNQDPKLDTFLDTLRYGLLIIIHLLSPILVNTTSVMLEQIGWRKGLIPFSELTQIDKLTFKALGPKKNVFNRLKLKGV